MSKAKSGVESFVRAHRDFESNGAARSPEWLKRLRQRAVREFQDQGFPDSKVEEWRFTNVQPIAETPFVLSNDPGDPDESLLAGFLLEGTAPRVVTVDGRFSPGLSNTGSIEGSRVVMGGLEAALLEGSPLIERHLGRYADATANPFSALGTAFVRDGAFVYIPEGVELDELLQLIHLYTDSNEPVMSHPRTLIVLGENAGCHLVETYAGSGSNVRLTNAVTEVVVGEGAHGSCTRIGIEEESAFHVGNTVIHQAKDSSFALTCVTVGGRLTRHDIVSVLDGEGAENTLNGLYMPAGKQHVDYHTTLDHAKPHCNSFEFFNGILGDHSRGVFNGRIIVREGAQKTDSKQTNNNLLLSGSARADSQPQLEIYADDVRCTHGATLGPLDQNAAFYLQSRGLSSEAARKLMTYGFAVEVIQRVESEPVRKYLDEMVKDRLDQMVAAG